MPSAVPRTPDGQSPALAVSNLVVRTLSEATGRGPTRARTYFNPDLVTVVVGDLLTKAERILVAEGRHQLVLETRRAFEAIVRAPLVAGVEAITARSVTAYMSANHVDPEIAVHLFVLAPGAETSET